MRRNSGKKYVCTADLNFSPGFVYTQLEHTQKGIKNMLKGKNYQFWFCTGSQDLYGDECLRKVAEHSKIIVEELNKSGVLPFECKDMIFSSLKVYQQHLYAKRKTYCRHL